jgi:hypothetical protein
LEASEFVNSYAYAGSNPVVNKDPSGRVLLPVILAAVEVYGIAMTAVDAYDAYNTQLAYRTGSSKEEKQMSTVQLGYDGVQQAIGSALAKRGWKEVAPAIGVMQAASDVVTKSPDAIKYFGEGQFVKDVQDVSSWAVVGASRSVTNIRSAISGKSSMKGEQGSKTDSYVYAANSAPGNKTSSSSSSSTSINWKALNVTSSTR